jgi:hypothetical protein
MTNDQLIYYFHETFNRIMDLRKLKSSDYGESEDAFATVRRLAMNAGVNPQHALFVLMCKHWDVIRKYVINPVGPRSEPVESRIDDLIVYLVLLRALIDERRGPEEVVSSQSAPVRLDSRRDRAD